MFRILPAAVFVVMMAALPSSGLSADKSPEQPGLAGPAYQVLHDRCFRCHGGSSRQAGLDVLSRENLLALRGESGAKYAFVVPGKPDESQLLDTIKGGAESYMPKEGSPEAKAMTDAEKEMLVQWVTAGAPFPERPVRRFLSESGVLSALRERLLKARADDRQFLRFYSFAHLHNNPHVSDRDLRLYRAALAKVLNSLTRERDIVLPEAVAGTEDSVFAIDLRKLGWDRGGKWNAIIGEYPYGLKYDFVKDQTLSEEAKNVRQFSGTDLPYLRADWFIVTATRPPLYHTLLEIPSALSALEEELQLDIEQNFLGDRVQRSGFATSGVSKQNRLLERHTSPITPYFWISYDFLPKRAKGDLTRFPLGPRFDANPFNNQAFEHDGGEIIWGLPNGMQAYMLVKANGERIDAGPVEVVFDRAAVLGTPSIVNGISCIYCHRDGMIPDFRDEVREADAVGGDALLKVRKLHVPPDDLQKLVRADQQRFLRALEAVVGPYLKAGEDAGRSIDQFPEPVGKVAAMYSRDLTAHEVALELGIEKLETLQAKIESNRNLLRFGLGALVQNPPATLKREKWETRDGTSLMQDVALELRLGLPFVGARSE